MSQDREIVRQVVNGDADAFRLLVERYNRPVISMIRNIVNDYAAAEDIAQDVFLTAYKKLNTFDNARSRFSTWLFTIAKNKSINAIRAQSRRKRIESQYQRPENPDEKNNEDVFKQLDAALERIPRKQKTAFVMAHFENLPYAEIAQIEGVSIGTIRSRVFRAKKKIAAAIKKDGDK